MTSLPFHQFPPVLADPDAGTASPALTRLDKPVDVAGRVVGDPAVDDFGCLPRTTEGQLADASVKHVLQVVGEPDAHLESP